MDEVGYGLSGEQFEAILASCLYILVVIARMEKVL